MYDNLTTYKIWAPHDALWTQWAKPAAFINPPYSQSFGPLEIPEIDWITQAENKRMVIVDLKSNEGVEEGLALAKIGYRPVPLYNGVYAPSPASMTVDAGKIAAALYQRAETLDKLNLRNDAPPAFLLDSQRMDGSKKAPGKYDNRWCIFPQDMPSADFILSRGIEEVLVRSMEIQTDLSHILLRYQEKGIKIYISSPGQNIRKVNVEKPPYFKSMIYRFQVTMGLRRNFAGGFGGKIPEPMENNSGRTYYGFG